MSSLTLQQHRSVTYDLANKYDEDCTFLRCEFQTHHWVCHSFVITFSIFHLVDILFIEISYMYMHYI